MNESSDERIADALDRQTAAIEKQTDLLAQIAGALFHMAEQGSQDEGDRRTYLDGSTD